MSLERSFVLSIASLALAASPAMAGLKYTVSVHSGGDGDYGGSVDARMDVSVSGASAKAVFATPLPTLSAGSYLLTTDGGAKTVLVDPEAHTYSAFGAGVLSGMPSNIDSLQNGTAMVPMTTENVKVEELGADDGGTIEGFHAKHVRIRVSYDRILKVPMMKQSMRTVIEDEVWVTDEVSDAGTKVWTVRPPEVPGGVGAAELAAAYGKIQGFVLKSKRTTSSKAGHDFRAMTETSEVSSVVKADIPEDTFAIPAGFEEVQGGPMRPQGGSQMPDLPDE